MESRLLLGDCRDVLAELPAGVADSVVTDPPYELGFMGKAWDASEVTYEIRTWRAILRAVKPGGYLLAFGGTRTSHRLACAIEDAGFEIRDTIAWMYGTGFPKSMDVSKQIDKMVEAKLKRRLSAPSGQWAGWGTALKPAFEPVVVAQRPLMEKTIAGNVMRIGTGALNIDGCRIEGESGDGNWSGRDVGGGSWFITYKRDDQPGEAHDRGRWPANVILDEAAAEMLDDQTGGSESRFFYSAKASKGERNAGLDGFEERVWADDVLDSAPLDGRRPDRRR